MAFLKIDHFGNGFGAEPWRRSAVAIAPVRRMGMNMPGHFPPDPDVPGDREVAE